MRLNRPLLVLLVALGSIQPAAAATRIFPIGAIEDLWNLPADEFRQKYPGINATGLGPSDEGWYVRYRHENLIYLFGQIADRLTLRPPETEFERGLKRLGSLLTEIMFVLVLARVPMRKALPGSW